MITYILANAINEKKVGWVERSKVLGFAWKYLIYRNTSPLMEQLAKPNMTGSTQPTFKHFICSLRKYNLRNLSLAGTVFFFFFLCAEILFADEFSIIDDSTIIGRNFGSPTNDILEDKSSPGSVGILLETAIFIKNLEISQLSDQGLEGETYIQSMMPARLYYKASPKITIEAGVLLGYLFGDENDLKTVSPLARMICEPAEDIFLVAGTIFPTHYIHDAILDDVQKFGTNDADLEYSSNVEQGFQFRMDRKMIKQDIWINWKTREEKERREEFEAACATRFQFFNDALFTDFHVRTVHIGGQNNVLDQGVDENLSAMVGLSWGFFDLFGMKNLKELRVGGRYLISSDSTLYDETEDGSGAEAFLTMDILPSPDIYLRLNASYFAGEDFYSRGGDPMYTLDDYAQFGITSVFKLHRELTVETGGVFQYNEDALNFTFMVNFVWGHGFSIP